MVSLETVVPPATARLEPFLLALLDLLAAREPMMPPTTAPMMMRSKRRPPMIHHLRLLDLGAARWAGL